MKKRKILSLLVALTLFIGLVPTVSAASFDFPDMPAEDFWSYPALSNAIDNGLLQGTDGKLLPKNNLTRAQMATILVRAFKAVDIAPGFSFSDVASWQWFTVDLSRAYRMDIVNGYPDGTMKPDDSITREQAFAILARAFSLTEANTINTTFSDVADVSDWAEGLVYAMVNAGYVQGSGGKINPKGLITREEFAQLMDNMIKEYISVEGTYTEVTAGNLMVNVPDVTLKDVTVTGDLIIGDGVGNGDIVLDNVTVEGRLLIRGGGENSIKLVNKTSIGTIIINKDANGAVRIYAEDGTEVETIYVEDGFDNVILEGTYPAVTIVGDGITVNLTNATVDNANIIGNVSNFVVGKDSSVATIVVTGSNVAISGEGTVANVNVTGTASKVSVLTPNTKITVASTASGVTGGGGEPVDPGTTASNTADGSALVGGAAPGGGGPPPAPANNVLTLYLKLGGLDSVAIEYEYAPTATISSVLDSVLSNPALGTGIGALVNKLNERELLENGVPVIIDEGLTLKDLYAKSSAKSATIAANLFAAGDELTAFTDAINVGNVFGAEAILDSATLAANFKTMAKASLDLIEKGVLKGSKSDLAGAIHRGYFAPFTLGISEDRVAAFVEAVSGKSATMADMITVFGTDTVTLVSGDYDADTLATLLSNKIFDLPGDVDVEALATAIFEKLGDSLSYTIKITVDLK